MKTCIYSQIQDFSTTISRLFKVPSLAVNVFAEGERRPFVYGSRSACSDANESTYYYISSCTKAFTAMLVGIAAEEGRLSLDAPVREQFGLGKLFLDEETDEKATLRDLLEHLTGLPRHEFMQASCTSREELARRIRYLRPSEPYRTKYQYQNQVYVLVGYILEKVYGKSWEELVSEKIAKPLGIDMHFRGDSSTETLAEPYMISLFSRSRAELNTSSIDNPCGGIVLNNVGLRLWLDELLACSHGRGRLISRSTFETLTTSDFVRREPDERGRMREIGYACGWSTEYRNNVKIISHGGVNMGFQSEVLLIPELDCGLTVVTNCLGLPVPQMIREFFLDHIFEEERRNYFVYYGKQFAKALIAGRKTKPAGKDIEPATTPSSRFIGRYFDEGYGDAAVTDCEGGLMLEYYGSSYALRHIGGDSYQADLPLGQKATVRFTDETMEMDIFAGNTANVIFRAQER